MTSFKHIVRPDDILIHKRGTSHVTPHRYMLQSGNEKECIDVAILAEGYTEKEMDLFYQDAQKACESLFFARTVPVDEKQVQHSGCSQSVD